MRNHRLRRGIAISALLVSGIGGIASAQDAENSEAIGDDVRRLGAVTVTSQKREQSLQDVPVAVTAISGDLIENALVSDVANLFEVSPSITYTQSSNQLQSGVRIRGIGTQVFSQTVEPSVSFVVDGVVIARQGQAFTDLIDIERVEVLRGPQGTLFGKNASAGLIHIITQRPSDEFEGKASVLFAEDNQLEGRFTVSGALSDSVRGRLTGYAKTRDGHITNVADGRDLNGNESSGARGQLDIDFSSNFNLRLIGDYSQSEADCCQWTVREAGDTFASRIAPVIASDENREVNIGADVQADSEQWGLSGEATWGLGDFELTSITAYREWEFQNNTDVDQTPFPENTAGRFYFDINGNDQTNTQFTQELRLTSPVGETIEYILGLYYFDLEIDTLFLRDFSIGLGGPAAFPIQRWNSATITETEHAAIFGHATWNVSDDFRVFGGLRLIDEEVGYSTSRSNIFNGAPVQIDVARSVSDTGASGTIGVQKDFSDDVMAYASYSRSYKGRAWDSGENFQQAQLEGFDPLEAETGDAFEIGLKSNLFDNRLQLNLAAFYTKYDDFQAQAFDPAQNVTTLFNVGAIETSGLEADFVALLGEGWTINGGLALVDASVDSFPNGPCYFGQAVGPNDCIDVDADGTGDIQDLAGADLPNSPDWKANLNIRYEQELQFGSNPTGFVQAGIVAQDDVLFGFNQDPGTLQESYALVDFSAGVDFQNFGASIFVKNAFDQNYASSIFGAFTFIDPGGFNQFLNRESQRYAGASLNVRF